MKGKKRLFLYEHLVELDSLNTPEKTKAYSLLSSLLAGNAFATFLFTALFMIAGASFLFHSLEMIVVILLVAFFYLWSLGEIIVCWAKVNVFKTPWYPLGYLVYFVALCVLLSVLSFNVIDIPIFPSVSWIRLRHVLFVFLYLPSFWVPFALSWKKIVAKGVSMKSGGKKME